ncbi:MAG: 30S ribosomal protein S6 [Kiritimatiellaeota bacterium]|nr:30S ribosomal protein S6 [Kiritimatiellota bacterium]
MKKYDGLYIFSGQAKDDSLDKSVEKMGAEITRLGGELLETEILGKRTFARPMNKRENGVYVRIRFNLDPLQVTPLLNRYHLVEELFRVQILAVNECVEAKLAQQAAARRLREALAAQQAAEAAAAAGTFEEAAAEPAGAEPEPPADDYADDE